MWMQPSRDHGSGWLPCPRFLGLLSPFAVYGILDKPATAPPRRLLLRKSWLSWASIAMCVTQCMSASSPDGLVSGSSSDGQIGRRSPGRRLSCSQSHFLCGFTKSPTCERFSEPTTRNIAATCAGGCHGSRRGSNETIGAVPYALNLRIAYASSLSDLRESLAHFAVKALSY